MPEILGPMPMGQSLFQRSIGQSCYSAGPWWRVFTIRLGEDFLRAPYLEMPWRTVSSRARCKCDRDKPHDPLDPMCRRGIYAFVNRQHAEEEGSKIVAALEVDQREKGPGEFVETVVLAVLELRGEICLSFNPLLTVNGVTEARGDVGIIKRLIVFEDWCRGDEGADALAAKLAASYPVPVKVRRHNPAVADFLALQRTAFSSPGQQGFEAGRRGGVNRPWW